MKQLQDFVYKWRVLLIAAGVVFLLINLSIEMWRMPSYMRGNMMKEFDLYYHEIARVDKRIDDTQGEMSQNYTRTTRRTQYLYKLINRVVPPGQRHLLRNKHPIDKNFIWRHSSLGTERLAHP